MKRRKLKATLHPRSNLRVTLILCLLTCLCVCQDVFGQQAVKTAVPAKFTVGDFVYSAEGRRDPFEATYLTRIKKSRESSSVKKGYELEELKLVGTLKTDKGRFAMMEDMQGRGILFKKGDFLNNSLWVTDVQEGRVVLAYKLRGDTRNINIDIPRK